MQIDRDSYAEWILHCLGVYDNGEYLDKMEKDFEVDICPYESETIEDIVSELEYNQDNPRLGNTIACRIFDEIVDKAVQELEADESDFEINLSYPSKPEITCKGKKVTNWAQIREMYDAY